jgi:hypothetical protein
VKKDWNQAHLNGDNARDTADAAWARNDSIKLNGHLLDEDSASSIKAWPTLGLGVTRGLIGSIAAAATKNSEVDPIAIIGTTLAATGAMFGRSRFARVGETLHHARIFTNCVGSSSRARKGTSAGPAIRIVRAAEAVLQSQSTLPFPAGLSLRITPGPLSSGEGLIEAIRDKMDDEDTGGTNDKRLLVIEGEMGSALQPSNARATRCRRSCGAPGMA